MRHGVAVDVPDLAEVIMRVLDKVGELFVIGAVVFLYPAYDFFGCELAVIHGRAGLYEAADQPYARIGAGGWGDRRYAGPILGQKFAVDIGAGAVDVYIAAREMREQEVRAVIGGAGE